MSEALAFLALPALACVALVGIHAYFGLQVLARQVIFVDLALAQVAALGATVAFLLGHPPQSLAAHGYALGFTLAAAAILASTRAWSARVPQEAQIGVVYVVAAAAALLVVERSPMGAEHIRQMLTGNILTVGWNDLRTALPLYALVGAAYPWLARRTRASGWGAEFAFYAAFGLVVTSSVALAGVLLVFAFLIIPASIGVLYAERPRARLTIAWIAGTMVSLLGLALSYAMDWSTGATVVCAYGAALAIAGLARSGSRLWFPARAAAAAILAMSAAGILAFPRADQPLLDTLERFAPSIRGAYMDAKLQAVASDAQSYAARYESEAARLRALERERRWSGEALEEAEVRKIAAYLKTYQEMIRGETFVMREVRDRAREARRGWIAAPFLLAALLVAPWRRGRRLSRDSIRDTTRRSASRAPPPAWPDESR